MYTVRHVDKYKITCKQLTVTGLMKSCSLLYFSQTSRGPV